MESRNALIFPFTILFPGTTPLARFSNPKEFPPSLRPDSFTILRICTCLASSKPQPFRRDNHGVAYRKKRHNLAFFEFQQVSYFLRNRYLASGLYFTRHGLHCLYLQLNILKIRNIRIQNSHQDFFIRTAYRPLNAANPPSMSAAASTCPDNKARPSFVLCIFGNGAGRIPFL